MVKSRSLKITACLTTLFAFIVMGLGAFTRLIDAGLGCPDWPGCFGRLTVPHTAAEQAAVVAAYPHTTFAAYKAWAEMVHRYFAGTFSLLIMLVIGLSLYQAYRKNAARWHIGVALSLLALVIYQILLGQWTVTLKLMPIIVTQHLLGAYLLVSIVWYICLVHRTPQPSVMIAPKTLLQRLIVLTRIAIVLVALQILLGAWTSTHYAALSCAGFPGCFADATQSLHWQWSNAFAWWSPVDVWQADNGGMLAARQTIQMMHRTGALVVSIYLLGLFAYAVPRCQELPSLLKPFYFVAGVLILQVCLGMINVVFQLPVATAVSHTLCAILLLLSVLTLHYQLTQMVSERDKG